MATKYTSRIVVYIESVQSSLYSIQYRAVSQTNASQLSTSNKNETQIISCLDGALSVHCNSPLPKYRAPQGRWAPGPWHDVPVPPR